MKKYFFIPALLLLSACTVTYPSKFACERAISTAWGGSLAGPLGAVIAEDEYNGKHKGMDDDMRPYQGNVFSSCTVVGEPSTQPAQESAKPAPLTQVAPAPTAPLTTPQGK